MDEDIPSPTLLPTNIVAESDENKGMITVQTTTTTTTADYPDNDVNVVPYDDHVDGDNTALSESKGRAANNANVNALSNEDIDKLMVTMFCPSIGKDKIGSCGWAYKKLQVAHAKRNDNGKGGPATWSDFLNTLAGSQRGKNVKEEMRKLFDIVSKADYIPAPSLEVPFVYEWGGHYWFNRSRSVTTHATKAASKSDNDANRNSSQGYVRVSINGTYVCAHTVIWRFANAYAKIEQGKDVSHLTSQRDLADPDMFVAEPGVDNRARSMCARVNARINTHPRSLCKGKPLADCKHVSECPDRCMHEQPCIIPFQEPPTSPLYEDSNILNSPFASLGDLKRRFQGGGH